MFVCCGLKCMEYVSLSGFMEGCSLSWCWSLVCIVQFRTLRNICHEKCITKMMPIEYFVGYITQTGHIDMTFEIFEASCPHWWSIDNQKSFEKFSLFEYCKQIFLLFYDFKILKTVQISLMSVLQFIIYYVIKTKLLK